MDGNLHKNSRPYPVSGASEAGLDTKIPTYITEWWGRSWGWEVEGGRWRSGTPGNGSWRAGKLVWEKREMVKADSELLGWWQELILLGHRKQVRTCDIFSPTRLGGWTTTKALFKVLLRGLLIFWNLLRSGSEF